MSNTPSVTWWTLRYVPTWVTRRHMVSRICLHHPNMYDHPLVFRRVRDALSLMLYVVFFILLFVIWYFFVFCFAMELNCQFVYLIIMLVIKLNLSIFYPFDRDVFFYYDCKSRKALQHRVDTSACMWTISLRVYH